MAGTGSRDKAQVAADFDVEAAFDPDFDFDALFAADDEVAEPAPRVRVGHRRIAFALSVTIAALPLLFLDNFQATADTPTAKVDTAAAPSVEPATTRTAPDADATSALAASRIALPVATPFVADPTTTAPAPTTSTTAEPTTTTAKPKIVTLAAPTTTTTKAPAPTTTTTKAPAPTTTTTAAPAGERVVSAADPDDSATWDALARCEAGGNWAANTGNGYYGGLQFSLATWHDLGGDGYPHQASRARQIEVGRKLFDRSGWNAWPACARKLGWS
jgi:hypothetical protein